jgi:hypothetical protein
MELVIYPIYYFCLIAADKVNKNSCSQEARIYAKSLRSILPSRGFKIDPIKKSNIKFPDILICLLLKIPQKYITKATISPLIMEVTIMLPKLSIKKVIGSKPE